MATIALFASPLTAFCHGHTIGGDGELEAEILIGAARNAVHRGDLNTAVQRFTEFVKKYPDREDARREYADVLFQAGLVRQALTEYEKLLEKNPNDAELNRLLVAALLHVGDHPRAKARLAEVLELFPDRVDFALSLALLHALDDETPAARALVDRYIKGRPLESKKMRMQAASLFVQLKDKKLAGPLVDKLLDDDPDDAKVLALSVRYAMLAGDSQTAMQLAEKLNQLYPGNIDLNLELASSLYSAGKITEAGSLFDAVLAKAPTNQTALLGAARVAMRDYRLEQADEYLARVPADIRGRQWKLACAERDTIAGNYLRARRMLDGLLQENPADSRASLALADLDRAEHEFIKADCLYCSNDALGENTAAGRQYAVSLLLQDRYCEAERVCRRVLQLDPDDADTTIVLARVLLKLDRGEEAMSLLRRAEEISREASPESIYIEQCCCPESSSADAPLAASRPVYLAVSLYDLAMEDGRRELAKAILDAALQQYPQNAVLMTRLAEWHASFGTTCEAVRAACIYETLLEGDPDNQKWTLGLARANAAMRRYDRALALYHRLCAESPQNYQYVRETARVVFHVCGTEPAICEYNAAICCWPGLAEEVERLSWERAAKCTHNCAPSIASELYSSLLALEPYESHFAFELGQTLGALGETRQAICAYSHLLAGHPNHRDAKIALEGKCLDLEPQIFMEHAFSRERGRQGLTSIDRLGEYFGCRMPGADENEYLSLGYGLLNLAPTSGAATYGDALLIRAQKQLHGNFGPWFSPYTPCAAFIDCEVQSYDRMVSTRPEFIAGLKFRTFDDCVLTVSGVMQNVLENGESLQQDIYRGGLRTVLDFMPNNYWESQAVYELYGYSDDNLRHAAELRNRWQLTPDPRRISLLLDFYYWDFEYESVFSPGPDPFFDMTHPYWTPMDFAMGGAGLEWKQWLSHDRFDGADHCWVSFAVMKRWDSEDQNYTIYRGMFVWDITRRLSCYTSGEYNEGSPYQGTWSYAGLSWIF